MNSRRGFLKGVLAFTLVPNILDLPTAIPRHLVNPSFTALDRLDQIIRQELPDLIAESISIPLVFGEGYDNKSLWSERK